MLRTREGNIKHAIIPLCPGSLVGGAVLTDNSVPFAGKLNVILDPAVFQDKSEWRKKEGRKGGRWGERERK